MKKSSTPFSANDNNHLNVLLAEYQDISSVFEKSQENLVQVLGIGVAFSAGAIGSLTSQTMALTSGMAWILPLPFFFFYGLVIYMLHLRLGNFWNARVLETRINLMLPEISVIRSVPNFPSGRYFSSSRGNKKILFLFNLLVFMLAILQLSILGLCFWAIYATNHTAGTFFLSVYFIIASIEIVVMTSMNQELPLGFRALTEQIAELGRMPTEKEFRLLYSNLYKQTKDALLTHIIPRPWDIIAKGPHFWYGFFSAYIFYGINNSKALQSISVLFNAKVASRVNIGQIIFFGVLFFFLEEVLLQQAKLLWDDIRDVQRDNKLPLNKNRAFVSGLLSEKQAILNIGLRLLLAFTAGFLLGGMVIVLFFGVILLHQALYVLWAKPRAKKHPILLLFMLSPNTTLRFLSGFILITGFNTIDIPLTMVLSIAFYQSMANSALLWRIEVEHLKKQDEPAFLRPQSLFFLQNGKRVQLFALIGSLLVLVGLLYYVSYLPRFLLSGLLFQRYTLSTFVLFFVVIFLTSLLSAVGEKLIYNLKNLLVPLVWHRRELVKKIFVSVIYAIGNAMMFLGGFSFIIALFINNEKMFFLGFASYLVGQIFVYENMDFLDYTLARIKKQVSVFLKILPVFLFRANSKVTIFVLLKVLIDYDYALVVQKQDKADT